MADNPYAPPKADVGSGTADGAPAKPGAAARFLWTTCIGFPVFMAFVLLAARGKLLYGAIGSVVFAVISGLIALCIPVRSKWLFVTPSIVICVFIAYQIGSSR